MKGYIGKTIDINRRKTAYGFIWKYEEKEVIHG